MPNTLENKLIERAQQGDKNAFLQLIEQHHKTVERFAFQCGVHSNDVNDVTQEVFVKLYRFLGQFKEAKFTTWLYKITLNATRDYYRKEQRETRKEAKLQAQPPPTAPTTEQMMLRFEEDHILHNAIQKLDDKHRYPIILFYFHELKYEEIATVLDVSLSTVKMRLMRGKELLKRQLTKGETQHG